MAWLKPYLGRVMKLQKEQALADLTLVLKDGEVCTSRVLVASLSDVFHNMLTSDMKEKIKGEISLELVSKDDWHCILSFYLSGDSLVGVDNWERILGVAHMYDLEDLRKHCEQVLVDTLTLENWCDRLSLCELLNLDSTKKVLDFLKKNFNDVHHSDSFKAISEKNLLDLMRSEGVITTEESLCESVMRWLTCNNSNEKTTSEVLSLIKLEDLSTRYICDVLQPHDKVTGNGSMQEAIKAELNERKGLYKDSLHSNPCHRLPKGETSDVIVFGHDTSMKCRLFYCQKTEKRWLEFSPDKSKLQCGAVMVGDEIIITGGITAHEKETAVFNISSKIWSRRPNLQYGRRSHAMAAAGGSVFVVAGTTRNGKLLKSIEKLEGTRWSMIGNLKEDSGTPGVAAINNVLVVVGSAKNPKHIQTFDVTSKDAAVLDTHLPFPLRVARGASLEGNRAIFMGQNKTLVNVSQTSKTKYQVDQGVECGCKPTDDIPIILAMEGRHLLCIEGTEGLEGCASDRVHRYSLRGNPIDADDFPILPKAMLVQGTFLFPLIGMPRLLGDHQN